MRKKLSNGDIKAIESIFYASSVPTKATARNLLKATRKAPTQRNLKNITADLETAVEAGALGKEVTYNEEGNPITKYYVVGTVTSNGGTVPTYHGPDSTFIPGKDHKESYRKTRIAVGTADPHYRGGAIL